MTTCKPTTDGGVVVWSQAPSPTPDLKKSFIPNINAISILVNKFHKNILQRLVVDLWTFPKLPTHAQAWICNFQTGTL